MTQQKFSAVDIKGLTPAVDPAASSQVFALSGRNYTFDSLGPKSSFGNRFLLPQARSKPSNVQGIRFKSTTGDRCFTIDGDGIWEWSELLGGWQAVYLTADTSLNPARWTLGFLTDVVYFCHPSIGILVYDLESNLCQPHSQVGVGTPDQPIGLTVNSGRLCVLSKQFFSWSAPSDGLDFSPALGGGGFQLLTDRVSGQPIAITSYSGGCLSWTTGGVLRSEFTGDAMVFRHRSLNTDYRPVNSFCTARIDDDTTIILDERGLFQSNGDTITPYAAVFNEFLLGYIQQNRLDVGQSLRLEWDELQRQLYVSVSLSYGSALYDLCFVYYPPLDKWGQFNEQHYGILPFLIQTGVRANNYFGFVDSDGCARLWQIIGNKETRVDDADFTGANLFYPVIPLIAEFSAGDIGVVLSSTGRLNTIGISDDSRIAGYYENSALLGIAASPVPPQIIGLNASLTLGLFRPEDQSSSDQMSEVVNVLLRSIQSGPAPELAIDYNLIPDGTDDEDYLLEAGAEDLGGESAAYVNHKLKVIGTLDGVTEFTSASPYEVSFSQGARYYACSVVGVWHMIEVDALDVGESFHLRTCEITAVDAGRLL